MAFPSTTGGQNYILMYKNSRIIIHCLWCLMIKIEWMFIIYVITHVATYSCDRRIVLIDWLTHVTMFRDRQWLVIAEHRIKSTIWHVIYRLCSRELCSMGSFIDRTVFRQLRLIVLMPSVCGVINSQTPTR